jgi:hypothetical protein
MLDKADIRNTILDAASAVLEGRDYTVTVLARDPSFSKVEPGWANLYRLLGASPTEQGYRFPVHLSLEIRTVLPGASAGCPGRIADLIKKRALNTDYVKILVIDEADEMLSQGFQEQVRNIFQFLPETVQAAIFSATMNREVLDISARFMINHVKIVMEADKLS